MAAFRSAGFGAGLRLLAAVGIAAGLAACGGSGGDGLTVTSVTFLEAQADLSVCPEPTDRELTIVVTWSNGSTVEVPGGSLPFTWTWSSDDPSVATVAAGTVTAVSMGRTTVRATFGAFEATVPVAVRCPPGPTGGPVPVSDVGTANSITGGAGGHASRNVAIDDLGRVHVAFFDSATGLRYARSVDGGLSFQASTLLVPVGDAPAPWPIIACGQDAQDNVYVVYQDGADAVRCLRSADGGTSWATPGVVTGLPTGEKSAAVRGATVMIFTPSGSTMARSTDAGQTFGPTVPNLLTSSVFNDVLMDPRDAVGVVAISDDPSLHVKTSADDGATFGAQTDSSTPPLFYSDFAIDQLGNVFGVSANGPWVRVDVDTLAVTTVASSLEGTGNPGRAVAVDALDVVHVVRESGGAILLQTSSDQGATLTPEATLDTGAQTPECAGSFFFPGVGVIYVKGGGVFYVHN